MNIRAAIVGSCLLALTGCAAFQGRPDFPNAGMLPPETQKITAAAASPSIVFDWSGSSNCSAAINKDNQGFLPTDPTYQVERNNCIYEFLGAIDYQYNLYKEEVFKLTNGLNASADTLQTVLSAGATGVAGPTGQILSGIAASLGTLKGTINQDVLYSQTITAIIAKMDADRADKLSAILQQMQPLKPAAGNSPPPYTMYAASVDLLAYFEDGTVHHAIVDLQSTAGSKAVSCQAAVKNIQTTGNPLGTGPSGRAPTAAQQAASGC
jgi:hypothetical protein